jgi:hypothetical protein
MKDFYYILGATCNATPSEIDAAYQKLARRFYLNEGEQDDFMDDRLREITEAYDVLRDAKRRRQYDMAFRKTQQKQLAAFRIKYLNIGITIMFLAITALFAVYVFQTLRGHPAKKTTVVSPKLVEQPAIIAVPHPKKHHRSVSRVTQKPARIKDTVAKQSPPPTVYPIPVKTKADSSLVAIHANITGIVYLHESPDFSSQVVAKIPDGARAHLVHRGSAWDKIAYHGQAGYVIKSSVEGQ